MTGTPIPYHIGNDNLYLLLYLINMLGMAFLFLVNGDAIAERIKGMFYYGKQQLDTRYKISTFGNTLLFTQNILFFTIISLAYLQHQGKVQLHQESYIYIIVYGIVFTLFLLSKRLVYDFVNIVLFTHKQMREWRESYFFTIQLTGFILFPLITMVIFFPSTPQIIYYCYIALTVIIYLYMLFTRCFKIIFTKKHEILNIFLYLCAIELLPLAFLGKAVLATNSFLTIKF
ncbi:MAG: DUF4271 domain-containing protein [Bacteroidaceae bacterium]|nr:DUF4271 domain-containing protein [Bacteroidaceae bacterium]